MKIAKECHCDAAKPGLPDSTGISFNVYTYEVFPGSTPLLLLQA